MCTSFVIHEPELLISMNFDNDGKKFQLSLDSNHFICSIDIGSRYIPSFGISSSGNFINDLMVDYDEKGKYKRQSQKRWVNSKLVEQVLNNGFSTSDFNMLLNDLQIVYAPNSFTHNLLVDKNGNSYIIEPGYETSYYDCSKKIPVVLTNFQLDKLAKASDTSSISGFNRYQNISKEIEKEPSVTIDRAFNLLDEVKQDNENWKTELSMVYLPNAKTVFFSVNCNFSKRFKYDLKNGKLTKNKGFYDSSEIQFDNKIITLNEIYSIV